MDNHPLNAAQREADLAKMFKRESAARLRTINELLAVLELHVAYEATPGDRGGKNGRKGRARTAFYEARDAALAKARGAT